MTRAVLIVIDDIGVEQLACYQDQAQYVEPFAYPLTPNLDAFAAGGVRFTQARGSPRCSITRSQILTGCYGFRTGLGENVGPTKTSASFLELGNPNPVLGLPSLLSGPRGAVGKWHLAMREADGGTFPDHAQQSLGFTSWRGVFSNLDADAVAQAGYRSFMWHQKADATWGEEWVTPSSGIFATQHVRSQAARWMELKNNFSLAYIAFHAAHEPYAAASIPPVETHGFGASINSSFKSTLYRALIENLDYELGLLLADIPSDAYVFIIGDNGTPGFVLNAAAGEPRYPTTHPLHALANGDDPLDFAPYASARAKGSVYETGIRIPLLVRGPGVIPGVCNEPVDAVDVFATVCTLLGVTVPGGAARDSIPFDDCLLEGWTDRAYSFSERFSPNGVGEVRDLEDRAYVRHDYPHAWKIVRRLGVPDEFYDVVEDPLEENDLGTSHAEYADTADALGALISS